jgi:hypothetical protein
MPRQVSGCSRKDPEPPQHGVLNQLMQCSVEIAPPAKPTGAATRDVPRQTPAYTSCECPRRGRADSRFVSALPEHSMGQPRCSVFVHSGGLMLGGETLAIMRGCRISRGDGSSLSICSTTGAPAKLIPRAAVGAGVASAIVVGDFPTPPRLMRQRPWRRGRRR